MAGSQTKSDLMKTFTSEEIEEILTESDSKRTCSDLGFFSKPFLVHHSDKEYVVKLYLPIKDNDLVSLILKNHDDYVAELRSAGLKVPDTIIYNRHAGNKNQLIIIQDAFREDELLRNRIKEAGLADLYKLCTLVFNDIIHFWINRRNISGFGFHPTLRNYSFHDGKLCFFDTFPPMLMNQRQLNRIILSMSPFGGVIKSFIPLFLINKVSDEYYHLNRMFTGIVGSCCRLRPADAPYILSFSREYVTTADSLSESEKKNILKLLMNPPKLSAIWILIRKLSGNTGNPNINIPSPA